MVDLFVEAHERAPSEIILDLDADSNASRTAFRRIADRIPNDRGQRSDDRGQWWMIG